MKEFLSTPEIPTMKVEHEDARRVIREVALRQRDGSLRRVTSIEVKAPDGDEQVVLGNHSHTKPEDFVVLSGKPKLFTAPSESPGDVTERSFPEGGDVTIEPGVAHAFVFDQPGEIRSTMEGTLAESGTKHHKVV